MSLIWVTKTQAGPGNPDLASCADSKIIFAPLLRVLPAKPCPAAPPHTAALVFSSKNAIRQFCVNYSARHWPVYCVGDATADMARRAGFTQVWSSGKDVHALTDLVARKEADQDRLIYYAGPAEPSGDLVGALQKLGFQAEAAVFYKTRSVPALPEQIQNALSGGQDIQVLLYSPKGAKAFSELLHNWQDENAKPDSTIIAYCISPAAEAALNVPWITARRIAAHPDEAALLALLDHKAQ